MKRCSRCREEKALDEFWRGTSKDGRCNYCKACARQWREENRQRVRENERRRYAANPERGRARAQRWREKNREVVNGRARKAYYENGGLEYAREQRRKNPERFREAVRRCYQKNRAKRLDWAHRRRLIEDSGAVDEGSLAGLIEQPCAYCGVEGPSEIDHVVPLSRGGTHELVNLAPACRTCNASKGDRVLSDWLERVA